MQDNTFIGSVDKDVNIFEEAFMMLTTMHFTEVCLHTHAHACTRKLQTTE